ncbi:MAG: hypothetical protein LQ347_005146 [Umbilicaria vellea]|nr:MAG: hypothetical protein LQ347_005146 [Umbilicaria vellea]
MSEEESMVALEECLSCDLDRPGTIAITPAELPKNGPRLVTEFSTEFSRSFGGALAGNRFIPSTSPHVPPIVSAERYVTPVP